MARAHFPPFGAKTSRGKAGEFAGSAQEGIYYGESRPDSGNLPKRREEKAFGGSKPNTGIVLIPNREFHHSSRDVKFSLNFPLFLQPRQFSVPTRKIYSSSDPPVPQMLLICRPPHSNWILGGPPPWGGERTHAIEELLREKGPRRGLQEDGGHILQNLRRRCPGASH